jgi:hypothetical protein
MAAGILDVDVDGQLRIYPQGHIDVKPDRDGCRLSVQPWGLLLLYLPAVPKIRRTGMVRVEFGCRSELAGFCQKGRLLQIRCKNNKTRPARLSG